VLCKAHQVRLQTWLPLCSNSDRLTRKALHSSANAVLFHEFLLAGITCFKPTNLNPKFFPSMPITLEENQQLNLNTTLYDEIRACHSLHNIAISNSIFSSTIPNICQECAAIFQLQPLTTTVCVRHLSQVFLTQSTKSTFTYALLYSKGTYIHC